MKLLSLEVENLFMYEDEIIDFTKLDFTLFRGDTGSGKSSIFDILTLAFFGSTARKKYKSYIKDTPKKKVTGKVCVKFYGDDNKSYKINRIFGRGKKLELYKNNKLLKLRTPTLIQDEIVKIIGMDFNTFLNVCYFSQGDIGKFLSTDSTGRIKIISEILNLSVFDKAKDVVNKKIKKMSTKIIDKKGTLNGLISVRDDIDLKKYENEISMYGERQKEISSEMTSLSQDLVDTREKIELINKRNGLITDLNLKIEMMSDRIEDFDEEIETIKNDKSPIKNVKKKLKRVDEKLSKLDGVKSDIWKIEKKLLKKDKVIDKITADVVVREDVLKKYKKVLNNVGERCPMCKSTITKNSTAFLRKMQGDASVELSKVYKTLEKKKKTLETMLDELGDLKKQCLNENEWTKSQMKYKNAIEKQDDRKEKIADLKVKKNKLIVKKKSYVKSEDVKIKNLKSDLKYYEEFDIEKIDELESKYKKIDDENNKINIKLESNKAKVDRYYKIEKKIKKIKSYVEKYESDYKVMDWWKDAYPKIKLMMIMDLIPFIESEANRYLSQILAGKIIKIKIDPTKKTNKMDIMIIDYVHNRKRIFEGWSGGEKSKMSLSIYLALNKLVSMRVNKNIDFLILDEKFSNLDIESRNKVFAMLKEECNDRKIFCISHVEGIDSEFNQVVTITKNKKRAKVDVCQN